ncbi:MAG: tetratricopeptide repeat protein [Pseudomonadota bacterium]
MVLLALLLLPDDIRADDLPVSPSTVADMLIEAGMVSKERFEEVDDRYVGPLLIGGQGEPGEDDLEGRGMSVLIYPGEAGGTAQIQFIVIPPWDNLGSRIDAIAAIVSEVAGPTPEGPAFTADDDPVRAAMSPGGQWLYGIMLESWLGWPGSPQRVVRVIDGVAVIIEGVPPEIWGITIVPDAGYGDWTWPGMSPDTDSDEVKEARLAIRSGDYARAVELLEAAGERDEAAAGALMGDMYRLARIGPADQEEASDWYLIGGRHGYGPAIYGLAMMAKDGWGIVPMNNLRLPLLEDAKEAGMADAVYVLSSQPDGVFYMRPEGVSQIDQVHQAAEWGLLAAQLDLAERYATGNGVDADPVRAYAWASVALANTDPGLDYIRAHQLEADIGSALSDEQRDEARSLAQELASSGAN